ncbi:dCMP deaminase [Gordonia phage GMA2]|uniref:CMP/dCMP-type deaminase domain-containing protein n=1 Tax=Gordonia phage GMA2 TaxID=1647283 RepID=A0A0K0N781_9CAUD|nr:dCMP deaminase [Gordonia phage GMA2]AKJ72608.1 hypothetical protein GMA2_70 [Gordonia phage GMA2]
MTEADRPSWDQVWMQMAITIAARSKCERAQIGCVIVASDQTVISSSYNGPAPSFPASGPCSNWCERARTGETDDTYSNCPACHSEANAIARADWSRTVGATAFVSGSVCINCAKLLAAAQIVRVVHIVNDGDSHRNPETVEQFLMSCGIEVNRIDSTTVQE